MKCISCDNQTNTDPAYGAVKCSDCLKKDREISKKYNNQAEFITLTQQSRIQSQRENYEKDIIQPYDSKGKPNPDFVKAYPEYRNEYFTKEELNKL